MAWHQGLLTQNREPRIWAELKLEHATIRRVYQPVSCLPLEGHHFRSQSLDHSLFYLPTVTLFFTMKHTLISAVLLAASTANARALRRDLTVQTISGWSSMGCYSDSQQARALSQLKGVGQDVSGTECQAHCQQLGYLYAGVEFGGQCYCDNSVNAASLQVSSSDCNVTCPGDSTQPCGAADRINLFYQGVSQSYNVPGWTSYGCMTDDVSKRALSHRINADNMTPQVCASACAAANYALAGVEYGSECYCDNYIQNNQTLASDPTTCNMACAGDASLAVCTRLNSRSC